MWGSWCVLPLVFRVRIEATGRFPEFKGTVLRGAFGIQFRKTVCATRLPDCAGCSLAGRCAFPWVFDTPGAGSADPRLASCRTHAPHPFAIRAPEDARVEVPAGTEWRFGFAIVGRARELLPYFIHAFLLLEEAGLGLDRAPVRVLDVVAELPGGPWTVYSEGAPALRYPPSAVGWPDAAHEAPAGSGDGGPGRAHDAGTGAEYGGVEKRGGAEAEKSGRLSVRFDSPVRIRAEGALSRELPFPVLARAALRRVTALHLLYCGPLPEMDTRPLLAEAEKVRTVGSDLRMRSISRYSTRSRRRMSFHGVEGRIEYEGPIARWLPVLRAAAAVNIGKGATFGFGAMRIEYREV